MDLQGCDNNSTVACNSSIFHQINNAKIISNKLVDITKYKIREFDDKWNFTIDDQIYETGVFKISYTISATGKNYYINDKLVPAWQQARLFVQDRLYNQVKSLIGGTLEINSGSNSACDASQDISMIHNTGNGSLSGFNTISSGSPTYEIYNETIKCDSSESDGTFSVTYNAILKNYNSSVDPQANAAIHTFTKDINISTDQNVEASISVKGTIQGLVRGGFIFYNNDFSLPSSGTFVTTINAGETKYSNAINHYASNIGSKTDLYESIKNTLNITKSQLLIKGQDGYPIPSTFSVDHNYTEGTVGYSAVYTKSLANSVDRGFTNISITREDPVDIIQEFIVPGRIQGPIIQKLNMKTARTVSVNIDGASPANKSCEITDVCNNIPYFSIENFEQLLSENNRWLKTKEDYTVNKLDGSYSISLEYTIRNC